MLRWAVIVLAILPFQLPLIRHLSFGPEATGFVQYDSAYYVANGRAVFERGNGFAHPNPFDPAATAPVIYFHWLTWVLGAGVKFLPVDPGVWFVALGLVAAVLCSAATLWLVEAVLPDGRGRLALFLLTMWAGGVVCLGAAAVNVGAGRAPGADLFALDAGEGWWFSNWGRNLILPTEAVYHALVALAWGALLRGRAALALGAVGALAATHPFSGLQHLLIVGAWLALAAVRRPSRGAWLHAGIAGLMLAAFAGYYFWFLNRFPAHRQLTAVWSTVWRMPMSAIVLSIAPALALALVRLRRRRRVPDDAQLFLVLAFALTFLLLKHDWFIAPHQPAHFSRGYHWLPIWLLALPLVQEAGWAWRPGGSRLVRYALAGLAAAVLVSDNALFLAREWTHGEGDRLHLSATQREMLGWMDRAELRGVLLCADTRLSYLAAAYTGARPYYGHLNNTPDIHVRWREVSAWQRRGETGEWLAAIDYVLIARTDPPAKFDWPAWRELHRNHDYVLLLRR